MGRQNGQQKIPVDALSTPSMASQRILEPALVLPSLILTTPNVRSNILRPAPQMHLQKIFIAAGATTIKDTLRTHNPSQTNKPQPQHDTNPSRPKPFCGPFQPKPPALENSLTHGSATPRFPVLLQTSTLRSKPNLVFSGNTLRRSASFFPSHRKVIESQNGPARQILEGRWIDTKAGSRGRSRALSRIPATTSSHFEPPACGHCD